ncbi:MAG: WYL domain-containing protein [Erysipelotrichaceae bacterium]
MSQIKRILRIVELLYDTDYEHPTSIKKMNEVLENESYEGHKMTFERKMFYSLIDDLRDIGYNIEACGNNYYWDHDRLDETQLFILLKIINSSTTITKKHSEEIIEKLLNITCSQNRDNLRKWVVDNPKKSKNEKILYCVNDLVKAIDNHVKVTFDYYKSDNKVKSYRISPYFVHYNHDHFYLIGSHPTRTGFNIYRLDRMKDLKVGKKKYDEHVTIESVNEYIRDNIDMYHGKVYNATIAFKREIENQIYDYFGQGIIIDKGRMDWYKVNVSVNDAPTFFGWMAQYGNEIKIMAPASLKNKYINYIKSVLSLYGVEDNSGLIEEKIPS